MSNKLDELAEQYRSALQNYLAVQGEAALEHAYELGRKAIMDGLGVLEMAAIHHEAMLRILDSLPTLEGGVKLLPAAAEFFAESLSPFEMAHRGFREANIKLRLLSEHLQSAREEERIRIARDIHDELGQTLTSLKIDLSWLHHRLRSWPHFQNQALARRRDPQGPLRSKEPPGGSPQKQASPLEKTKAMLKLIDSTIQTVRRIATELRPAVLDDLGLAAAVEWQTQDFQRRTGIRSRLTLPSQTLVLDPGRSTTVFRIFQEVLTNAARHSKATEVHIRLKKEKGRLVLTVKDNGRGITPVEILDTHSLGLLGMRERALFWGGEVDIRGFPGKGTTVVVRIPIQKTGRDGTP